MILMGTCFWACVVLLYTSDPTSRIKTIRPYIDWPSSYTRVVTISRSRWRHGSIIYKQLNHMFSSRGRLPSLSKPTGYIEVARCKCWSLVSSNPCDESIHPSSKISRNSYLMSLIIWGFPLTRQTPINWLHRDYVLHISHVPFWSHFELIPLRMNHILRVPPHSVHLESEMGSVHTLIYHV